jgi:7-cyano-7-deazaguanine reductase
MPKFSQYQQYLKKLAKFTPPALEVVKNPYAGRLYEVTFEIPEFTCVCPKTGHPDFACLSISYFPKDLLIELKSLKLYIEAYRNIGIFHEAASNLILQDLVKSVKPRRADLKADFNIRGGIHTIVKVSYPWKK